MTVSLVTSVSPKVAHSVLFTNKKIDEEVGVLEVEVVEEEDMNTVFPEPTSDIDNVPSPFKEF